jgi:hypothetical protein
MEFILIRYEAEFEGYLKKAKLKGNENVDDIIKSLNSVSERLGINISSKNLGSKEDMNDLSKQLLQAGKRPPKSLKKFELAMQHYVNMVNGL